MYKVNQLRCNLYNNTCSTSISRFSILFTFFNSGFIVLHSVIAFCNCPLFLIFWARTRPPSHPLNVQYDSCLETGEVPVFALNLNLLSHALPCVLDHYVVPANTVRGNSTATMRFLYFFLAFLYYV